MSLLSDLCWMVDPDTLDYGLDPESSTKSRCVASFYFQLPRVQTWLVGLDPELTKHLSPFSNIASRSVKIVDSTHISKMYWPDSIIYAKLLFI